MTSRLETISTELPKLVSEAGDDQLREAVAAACAAAIESSGGDAAEMLLALEVLRGTQHISDIERAELGRRLNSLQNTLDDAYLALMEEQTPGTESTERYMTEFMKARTAAALFFAMKGATAEAIYEACAAVPDRNDIVDIVRAALAGPRGT